MSIEKLKNIFEPKSIAVIGASGREGSIGYALMRNLIQGGFKGAIYPINPKYEYIWDVPAYPSVQAIKEQFDIAVIAAPISTAPQIIKECVDSGASGAVIISAGGKEAGTKGKQIESAIKAEAKDSGIRIIGPNCIGVISTHSFLNASFASGTPLPGKMAFVSQSGAICTSIIDLSIKEKMGFSHFISLGSMIDVDFGDIVDYLGGDYRVRSIVMYVENLTRFRRFMSAARAVSRMKPIIVYKAGRSKAGSAAAASHTGALAGEDEVYDTAFDRAGIIRVRTFEELFDCAELLAREPRPSGSGLAIITNAGGPGVMAVDALSFYGADPVRLMPKTIDQLNEILPPHWSHGNPIDILGDASSERYCKTVEICMKADEINGLLILMAPQALSDPTEVAKALVDLLINKKRFPVFTSWMGGRSMEPGRDIFNEAGITTFDTSERAVRAFMDLFKYSVNIEMLQEIPPKLPEKISFDTAKAKSIIDSALPRENGLLTEIESKNLLAAYGIPVTPTVLAISAEDAVQKALDLGFPVAMKICSPDITHKSDAGGVKLNLTSESDVRETFRCVTADAAKFDPAASIEGVTIQPMLKRPDYELIMGVKKDRDFGPVILFGLGGIMTEILKDRALALPPLNRLLARRLMEKTRVFRILKGYRNHPPADLEMLEEIIVRLSQLVIDFSEIEELDINPILITDESIRAVDARVRVKKSDIQAPLHLVISPYPGHYESGAVTAHGVNLFIRPIQPEDASLFVELFSALSPRSVYFRFFSPLKKLTPTMLTRFTQVDYDREIALVAMQASSEEEKFLGVARIILEPDENEAEFSVLVRDSWHGKGIGAELLKRCLDFAEERGVKKVWGLVLNENTHMLALGKKLGFDIKRVPESSEYELVFEFEKST